jgi:hypothetical protein
MSSSDSYANVTTTTTTSSSGGTVTTLSVVVVVIILTLLSIMSLLWMVFRGSSEFSDEESPVEGPQMAYQNQQEVICSTAISISSLPAACSGKSPKNEVANRNEGLIQDTSQSTINEAPTN